MVDPGPIVLEGSEAAYSLDSIRNHQLPTELCVYVDPSFTHIRQRNGRSLRQREFCDFGFEYQPSSNKSTDCCGNCVAVGCVVGAELKNIGEEWQSEDHCTTYTCRSINESVVVQSVTERCPELTAEEDEFEVEEQVLLGQCCPEIIRTGCKYNGHTYKPGEKWKLVDNICITESCVLKGNVTKQTEVEVCSKDCVPGWSYEEPKDGECCGRCKQDFCIVGDMLYEPGMSWSSSDNCTTYSCLDQGEQLSISSSSMVCPDVSDCPPDRIYMGSCCKKCNMTSHNQKMELCTAEVLDHPNTVGMFVTRHPTHGICKNMESVEGITECRGRCESTSFFDPENWSHAVNCQCCQPKEYVARYVTLTCEDGMKLRKQVPVPASCTCETCGTENFTKMRRENVKH